MLGSHFVQVGEVGRRAHSRTFTKVGHSFWPRLIATYALGWVGEPMHIIFFFFEGPKGRYGPREAWAHMGWVGHPAH